MKIEELEYEKSIIDWLISLGISPMESMHIFYWSDKFSTSLSEAYVDMKKNQKEKKE